MHNVMLGVLVVSMLALFILVLKKRSSGRLLGYAVFHALAAAVALYLLNTTQMLGDLTIPINPVSVMVMAVLGVPGLILLIALKVAVI
ncbi:hypothetical protein XYCOK13_41430 [Xylanibacillus composti]|uniref:Pro-sigmaK processing inhibitor BofA n=1 Tax=Xylanibacillus composti TaxID=1572762 RepID=A0A8J4H8X1_9BACL|nr:pro-sigmaK processing inhibitor BofA family protein [Xylanibacillus composti]GIQ71319.1 hypothetical protein XYCOK13_41430 [Xylanibacillus composti]